MTNAAGIGIESGAMELRDLLGERGAKFIIPDYQRRFQWEDEQLWKLWRDIEGARRHGTERFLGHLIMVEKDDKEFHVVDGQQRLVTLSVLICALRDRLMDHGDEWAVELDEYLSATDVETREDERRMQLHNHGDDKDQYRAVYCRQPDAESGKIVHAREFFSNRLEELSAERIDEIRRTLLQDFTVVRTQPNGIGTAHQVFRDHNTRGVDLPLKNLVRSTLFERAGKSTQVDDEEIKDMWLTVTDDLSRLGRSAPMRPLYHILMVNGHIGSWNPSGPNMRVFEQGFDSLSSGGETPLNIVQFFRREAKTYLSAVSPTLDDDYRSNLHFQHRSGELARLTRQCTFKAPHSGVLLYTLEKEIDDPERLKNCLRLLKTLTARLVMSDTHGGSKRRPVYTASKGICNGDEPEPAIKAEIRASTPTDEVIEKTVAQREFKRNRMTKSVLLDLEREYFSNNHHALTIDDFQLEHIAPRKAFSKDKYTPWRSELGFNENRFKNEYSGRLGNLTMLEDSQNQRAGTDPFKQKCREYHTSEFKMTRDLCNYDAWGMDEIGDRSSELAELVVDVYSLD